MRDSAEEMEYRVNGRPDSHPEPRMILHRCRKSGCPNLTMARGLCLTCSISQILRREKSTEKEAL
jgi:hypothetical protein